MVQASRPRSLTPLRAKASVWPQQVRNRSRSPLAQTLPIGRNRLKLSETSLVRDQSDGPRSPAVEHASYTSRLEPVQDPSNISQSRDGQNLSSTSRTEVVWHPSNPSRLQQGPDVSRSLAARDSPSPQRVLVFSSSSNPPGSSLFRASPSPSRVAKSSKIENRGNRTGSSSGEYFGNAEDWAGDEGINLDIPWDSKMDVGECTSLQS